MEQKAHKVYEKRCTHVPCEGVQDKSWLHMRDLGKQSKSGSLLQCCISLFCLLGILSRNKKKRSMRKIPSQEELDRCMMQAGPGRRLVVDGFQALCRGDPNMNTLVGLGATASFGISCVAAALPALGWRTFFEEPAMLLGVVLVGRALEERAQLQASSDLAALQVRLACFRGVIRQSICPICALCSALMVESGASLHSETGAFLLAEIGLLRGPEEAVLLARCWVVQLQA